MKGDQLRAARKAAHLTQRRLGELMNMKHWRDLSHMESGNRYIGPGMEARIRLALMKAKQEHHT